MVSCTQVACSVLVFLIGFILNALYQVGEFNVLYPLESRGCRRIEGYHGCEDFAYFSNKNIYMSCDDRSWLKYHSVGQTDNLEMRISKQKEQGQIYLLQNSNNYDKAKPVTIKGNKSKDFHPLGIASLEDKSGKWLFVTDNTREGEKVSIYRINSDTEIELYSSIILTEKYQMFNDIIAIPDSGGSFYVTIWLVNEPGTLLNFIDVYLKRAVSYVLFCEPLNGRKYFNIPPKNPSNDIDNWRCKKVVENLKMINGITISPDLNRIYMAETTSRTMNIYSRDSVTNDLELIKKVDTYSGCDNLEYALDGSIYLGCHPKGLTFSIHAAYPKAIVAPSRILKYTDNNNDNDKMEIIMQSTGEILSGSSLGLKMDNTLIIGSVHDDCYLLCDLE